jgi:hypothetical protein
VVLVVMVHLSRARPAAQPKRRASLEIKGVVVKKGQLIGGIVLLVLAALIFLSLDTTASVPVAITLSWTLSIFSGSRFRHMAHDTRVTGHGTVSTRP